MIPDLDILIKVIECPMHPHNCRECPYGYSYYDDNGDYGFWTCDTMRVEEESLFFLKLYQHLIEEDKNE
jgi:hypothetical protein